MDNISYLNQISSEANPEKEPKKPLSETLFSNKNLKIFILVAGGLIVLSIFFGIISNALNRESDYLPRLGMRSENIYSLVKTYNSKVKNPSLRAAGSSLSATLEVINATVPSYVGKSYEAPEFVADEESEILSGMSVALAEAKINGLLDRTYARQLAYGISLLVSLEEEVYENTTDSSVKAFITSSKESLNTILPAFSEYSDVTTKK